MFIESVTVCVGYADFLAQTLPHNLQHFDRMLVVTSYDDKETQRLCHDLSVECKQTDVMYHRGDDFAKGRAIDFGLGFLARTDWLVQLDADIYLPPTTRSWLDTADLDEDVIYGMDRMTCLGYDKWKQYLGNGPVHQHRQHCLVIPPPFPMGARISLREHSGYIPIGAYQMWHGKHQRRYPLIQGSAEHTDVLHALQWPHDKRLLIPELIAIHLESEVGPMGHNWHGRTTKRFGPEPLAQSDKPVYSYFG
jgi:hypothetical protein